MPGPGPHSVPGAGGLRGRGGEHRPAVRLGGGPREPGPVLAAEGSVCGQPEQLRLDPADAGGQVGPGPPVEAKTTTFQ